MKYYLTSARFVVVAAMAALFCVAAVLPASAQRWNDQNQGYYRHERRHHRTVRIENRWKPDQYINIEHGLASSGIRGRWLSARWHIERVRGTPFVRLRNDWKPELYINIQNGYVEASPIRPDWWSAMWLIQDAPDGYIRLENRWKHGEYLHIQRGHLECSTIRTKWWSAMWSLNPVRSDRWDNRDRRRDWDRRDRDRWDN